MEASKTEAISPPHHKGAHHLYMWAGIVLGFAVLLYFMPLFHVVSLSERQQKNETSHFNAADFVEGFWTEQLVEAAKKAVRAHTLLNALNEDAEAAAEKYGHRLGLSKRSSFLVAGQGRITAIEKEQVFITLNEETDARIVIDMGPVFSNAVRDGSGLLDVSDFANTQEYNAISAEINRRVEERILPYLAAGASIGKHVTFAGGSELTPSSGAPARLTLVPISIEFPAP